MGHCLVTISFMSRCPLAKAKNSIGQADCFYSFKNACKYNISWYCLTNSYLSLLRIFDFLCTCSCISCSNLSKISEIVYYTYCEFSLTRVILFLTKCI